MNDIIKRLNSFADWHTSCNGGNVSEESQTCIDAASDLAAKDAEIARLREALEPSAGTKAAYCGEFSFTIEDRDEDGEECFRHVSVPWTTVKEIMAAIRARAALEGALL